MQNSAKVEWHSVEHIPLLGGTVHVLYPTDGLDPKQNILVYFDRLVYVHLKNFRGLNALIR